MPALARALAVVSLLWWSFAPRGGLPRAAAEPAAVGEAGDALPGIARVGAPSELERGVGVSLLAGYGYTESVLDEGGDRHHRALGTLGVSYRHLRWLGLGLELDARWDRHDLESGDDESFVSDPRLHARAVAGAGALRYGAQATAWFPGDSPGEASFDAVSADLVAMGAYELGSTTLVANAGFRLDRSANSIDEPAALGDADRLALRVSDANAVLLGLGASQRLGSLELLGEWSWDYLVGDGAPAAIVSPMRLTGGVRWRATPLTQLDLRVDVSPQRRPLIGPDDPLVPVEPLFAVTVGMTVRFPRRPVELGGGGLEVAGRSPGGEAKAPPPGQLRTLRGRVVGAGGDPIADAEVRVTAGQKVALVTTDAEGAFVAEELPAFSAEVFVDAEGYESRNTEVPMKSGAEVEMEFVLERRQATGELRGVVISLRGQPLQAKISIEEAGARTTTDAEGAFVLELPAGTHQVRIRADGYQPQTREVKVEDNGVTVLNVDDMRKLRQKRRRRRR